MRPTLVLLAVLLAGCVRTTAIPLGAPVARPAVSPDSVVIYRTAEQVPGTFVEVAILTANGGNVSGGSRLLAELRKQAGARGANAILLVSTEAPQTATVTRGYRPVGTVESGSYVTKAVAIYVTP
jgi:hypothetical protein